jgi:hypothetical protein
MIMIDPNYVDAYNALSDTLLENCNKIIQSIADDYLIHIGDTYKELPCPNTQTENEDDNSDYQLDDHDEELDLILYCIVFKFTTLLEVTVIL